MCRIVRDLFNGSLNWTVREIDWLHPTAAQHVGRRGALSEETGMRFQTPANYHTQVKKGELNSVCTNEHTWLPDFVSSPANELFRQACPGYSQMR